MAIRFRKSAAGLTQFLKNSAQRKNFSKIDFSPVLYDGAERERGAECSTGVSPAAVVQDAERSEVS